MGQRPARRGVLTCVAAIASTLVMAGCASDLHGPALGPPVVETIAPVQKDAVTISARDNDFVDPQVAVVAGTKVTWHNDGRNDHNISAADPSGEFKVDAAHFGPKAAYSFTFTKPGTYHYFCTIHGTATKGMVGTIQVVEPNNGGKL